MSLVLPPLPPRRDTRALGVFDPTSRDFRGFGGMPLGCTFRVLDQFDRYVCSNRDIQNESCLGFNFPLGRESL